MAPKPCLRSTPYFQQWAAWHLLRPESKIAFPILVWLEMNSHLRLMSPFPFKRKPHCTESLY